MPLFPWSSIMLIKIECIVGLFETLKVSSEITIKQVNVPLVEFNLKNKVAPYVKNEKPI